MTARVLYLSYDGMCDPLGGSQVLPYLFGLARRGHKITLISFEKPDRPAEQRAAVMKSCADAGIAWRPLPYRKRPPVLSTMADVMKMTRLAAQLHRQTPFDIVHCRSYLSALVGLKMKQRFGTRFLFDMRGFWADERLESGSWKKSNPLLRAVYEYFKRQERAFWREADAMVSLTEAGKAVIAEVEDDAAPTCVIPCCVDFGVFKPATKAKRGEVRKQLGIGMSDHVLGYIGSLGGNYMLDEMLDFFRAYRDRHEAKFLFVTQVPGREILAAADRKGIARAELVIRAASRREVPYFMAAADHGIAFKQPSFSAKACSPTKLGEMLALDIPVVTNAGVGDVEEVIADTGAGVIVRSFDDTAYGTAIEELHALAPNRKQWQRRARRWFDLDSGIERYDALYRQMAAAQHA